MSLKLSFALESYLSCKSHDDIVEELKNLQLTEKNSPN